MALPPISLHVSPTETLLSSMDSAESKMIHKSQKNTDPLTADLVLSKTVWKTVAPGMPRNMKI